MSRICIPCLRHVNAPKKSGAPPGEALPCLRIMTDQQGTPDEIIDYTYLFRAKQQDGYSIIITGQSSGAVGKWVKFLYYSGTILGPQEYQQYIVISEWSGQFQKGENLLYTADTGPNDMDIDVTTQGEVQVQVDCDSGEGGPPWGDGDSGYSGGDIAPSLKPLTKKWLDAKESEEVFFVGQQYSPNHDDIEPDLASSYLVQVTNSEVPADKTGPGEAQAPDHVTQNLTVYDVQDVGGIDTACITATSKPAVLYPGMVIVNIATREEVQLENPLGRFEQVALGLPATHW